jgi:hypothetical protein
MVSTLKFKQKQIDLAKSMDGVLQSMEVQGAQNMIVKQEEFETKEGVKRLKRMGLFTNKCTTKSSTKLYYEALLFSQEGGLQQMLHEEGDTYANQYQSVLNSVELKQATK